MGSVHTQSGYLADVIAITFWNSLFWRKPDQNGSILILAFVLPWEYLLPSGGERTESGESVIVEGNIRMGNPKDARTILIAGACFAGTGVAAGAWGSHGLRMVLSPELLMVFETAVRYQMYHAFALFFVGILLMQADGSVRRRLRFSSAAFAAGIFLFSGSLYGLSLTGVRWLGAVTPLGGACFIAGWMLFGTGCWSMLKDP